MLDVIFKVRKCKINEMEDKNTHQKITYYQVVFDDGSREGVTFGCTKFFKDMCDEIHKTGSSDLVPVIKIQKKQDGTIQTRFDAYNPEVGDDDEY